jgi:EAL domain-containing protein (putative c-di-GMP-specific phosphodiesterase class I)
MTVETMTGHETLTAGAPAAVSTDAGSGRRIVLVIDDDPVVTTGLEMLLHEEGRTIILCSDLESAELVLARHPVTHVLSDVQFSGPLGYEGLHFLTRIRRQRPDCRIVLMTGLPTDTLRQAAAQCGVTTVLAKPFEIADLERALGLGERSRGAYQSLRVPALPEILQCGLLTAAFQPIVTPSGDAFGFEALARIRGDWPGGGIAELLDYATQRQQLAELNLAALETALRQAPMLPAGTLLFMNVDPATFHHPGLFETLQRTASRNGVPLSRIVLELTERSGFTDEAAALAVLARLAEAGVRFALDDHGSAYSHLSLIDRIRPTFIKISHTFGTAFEEDPMRMRVVRHIAAMARDFGCLTILEGVESAATAQAAAAHGIDLAQGFYFGRPNEASFWTDVPAGDGVRRIA